MLLYRCKVIRYLEENIHQNLLENMVRVLNRPSAEFFVHLVTHLLWEWERKETAKF
uniref:Macaca fascicularis brain cDNA clone: QmoA-10232, similar to human rap2 interacting protein x (RIPX), mRNA, RefSeq: NM_014961.2 n=1 Tax=Macaca fascicularis TaxID=9541 RepID=I7GKI3_MACFA|nr:unnamed protein product [Macaca fascicularis]